MQLTTLVPADVDVPDIEPDFSAPFFQGFQVDRVLHPRGSDARGPDHADYRGRLARLPRLASDRVRTWAGENILWIFIAAAVLGAASGLFQWFVNFDFGF